MSTSTILCIPSFPSKYSTIANATNEILKLIALQPNIGRLTSKRAFLRKILVAKRIILIYRFKPNGKLVELVQFFNTWQHPNKRKDTQ